MPVDLSPRWASIRVAAIATALAVFPALWVSRRGSRAVGFLSAVPIPMTLLYMFLSSGLALSGRQDAIFGPFGFSLT